MKWTPEEDAVLREHYPFMAAHELDLPGRTLRAIMFRAYILGVKKAPGMAVVFTRRKVGVHHWTDAERAVLMERFADDYSKNIARDIGLSDFQIWKEAKRLGLKKSAAYRARELLVKRERAKSNPNIKANGFQPGHVSWNKGLHYDSGGRSVETRFKKGHRPARLRPIGAERDIGGLLYRKVQEGGKIWGNWRLVHHLVWLEAGREIPPKHVLCFKDGNKRNFALDNLVLVSKAEIMARNTVHNFGPEISSVIRLNGQIKRATNQRRDKNEPKQ